MAKSDDMAAGKKLQGKRVQPRDAPRQNKVRRAGDLVADIGGTAFKRFGFAQSALIHRWPEIVGEKYAAGSLPESLRFPQGRKSGGALTLLVEGAQAPLFQHLAPMIMERVNIFFGYEAVVRVIFKQGSMPKRDAPLHRPRPQPVPKELGENLREVADPDLRASLEGLAASLAGSSGAPVIRIGDGPIPKIGKIK